MLLARCLDLIHANHLSQLYEPQAFERLGEDVSELSTGLDKLDDDLPLHRCSPGGSVT